MKPQRSVQEILFDLKWSRLEKIPLSGIFVTWSVFIYSFLSRDLGIILLKIEKLYINCRRTCILQKSCLEKHPL